MTFKMLLPLAAALTALSACGISQKQLSDFGETADQTVQIVGMASTVTENLIAQNEVTRNACGYLENTGYTLASPPKTKLSPLLSDQKAVVEGLAAYASAIAGALDAEQQAKVNAARDTLSTSAGELSNQVGADAPTGPTFSLLLTAIVKIEENRRIAAVKKEMANVYPFLLRLRDLLEKDQKRTLAEMDIQIAEWDQQTKCVLEASRYGDTTFRRADETKRTLIAQRKQAEKAVEAMTALIESHEKIIFRDGNFEDGLATLNTFLAKIQAIKDA